MATVSDGSDFAQDFIRLLRNENNALRSQIQQLEQQRAVSKQRPCYGPESLLAVAERLKASVLRRCACHGNVEKAVSGTSGRKKLSAHPGGGNKECTMHRCQPHARCRGAPPG